MKKITSITVQTKNKERCNIFINGEYLFALSLEAVIKNRLKVGEELTDEQVKALVKDGERASALNKAIAYVSKNLKTQKQVKEYLLRKGYDQKIAYFCIDKLKEYNLINDAEFAKRYIESACKTQGKYLYEHKLMMKGVKKEDIATGTNDLEINAKEYARELAEKHIRNKEITKENLSKTYRYIIGKGFSYEEAEYALSFLREKD